MAARLTSCCRHNIETHVGLHITCRYFYQILTKIEISNRFYENNPVSNFIEVRSLVIESFHAYRQTDRQTDGRSGGATLIGRPRGCERVPKEGNCNILGRSAVL
jgi:hypothetical protein